MLRRTFVTAAAMTAVLGGKSRTGNVQNKYRCAQSSDSKYRSFHFCPASRAIELVAASSSSQHRGADWCDDHGDATVVGSR